MTRPKLFLVDGHSLAYRAFYGLPASMVTTDGQQTNAIYGFAKMLLTIYEERKPAGIAVAFDLPQPTFRHTKYKEYKAHRPPSPEEFRSQVPLIKEMVRALGIPIFEMPGYEADDVLGTLAVKAAHEGMKAIIFTGDRDALQLVSEHIHALLPQKGVSETKEFDIKAVAEKYEGLTPGQLIDLKALMGDASDNIPGVTGVGEKTAIALVKEFGSLDNIYKDLSKIPRDVVRLKLQTQEHSARLSYELAKIDTAVPIDIDLNTCKLTDLTWDNAVPFFQKMQLNSLVKKYEGNLQNQGDLFAAVTQTQALDKEKVLEARLMKWLLNPERQLKNEDIGHNDIASIPDYIKELKERQLFKLYEELELPLADILDEMTEDGVKIDVGFLSKMSKDLEHFIQGLERVIYKLAGQEFNINSPKQMGDIFFNKLQMPVIKKTKTGFSTDAFVLEELSYEFDIAKKILEYRQLAKLKSTYVDALPLLVNPKTGKIHAAFNQTATSTGRLSSSDPNLQNIPIRSEAGKKIREAFIPEKAGHLILSADYSQIEFRILAHMAGEEHLLKALIDNQDIHRVTAAQVFGVPLEQVTDEQRSQSKAVNYGIAYGMSARKLSRTVGITIDQAKEFIETYFKTYPGIKRYMEETIATCRQQGYVTTLLGRRRYFPDINSSNKMLSSAAERGAINMPIQGTSADFIKIAMLKVHKELTDQKLKAKMIMQVHDELVFDVPEHEAYDLECLVKKQMGSVYPDLKVPLTVNIGTGKNWLEAK